MKTIYCQKCGKGKKIHAFAYSGNCQNCNWPYEQALDETYRFACDAMDHSNRTRQSWFWIMLGLIVILFVLGSFVTLGGF